MPQATDRAIALADATCAANTNLVAEWTSAIERSAQSYLAQHEADLIQWQAMITAAAQRARGLL